MSFTVPILDKMDGAAHNAGGHAVMGEARRQKSILVRQKRAAIRDCYGRHPEITQEELSLIFDVSEFTLKSLSPGMAETRLRRRQDKAAGRASEIRAYKTAHPFMSNRDIAKALGVSRQTINNAVKGGE